MRLLLAFLIALAAAAPASAQTEDRGLQVHAVSRDGFMIGLTHTADTRAFMRAWGGPLADLPVTERAVRGQPLQSIVFFQGCRTAADGKCNLVGHFTYLRPDGTVYGEGDANLFDMAPPRGAPGFFSPLGPSIIVEPEDPMGTWTLRVRVTDTVGGLSLTTETPIIVDTPPTAAAR